MRVVIADDAVIVREGVGRILVEAGHEPIGVAGDGVAAEQLIARLRPDVAVIDNRMPPGGSGEGLRLARAVRRLGGARIGMLILSQYVEPALAIAILADGADGIGYLLKDHVADAATLGEAVERVGQGGTVVDPAVVAELARHAGRSRVDELTEREREVLGLMAEGRSNAAICDRLTVSSKTVEAHVARIFSKLGLEPAYDDHRRVLAVLAYLRAVQTAGS